MLFVCVKAIMNLSSYNLHGCAFNNRIIREYRLIKKRKIFCLEKINSRELFHIQSIVKEENPTSPNITINVPKTPF